MTYYRLYFFDGSNHIEHFREFEANSDVEALRQSEDWRDVHAMELWSGGRKVSNWTSRSSSPEVDARAALHALRLTLYPTNDRLEP